MDSPRSDITALLATLASGDDSARAPLWTLVYTELRDMARLQLARERDGASLVPTALVHEAYLRLLGDVAGFENRAHFFGAAGNAMRRILVDHARSRQRDKRGGGIAPVTLSPELPLMTPSAERLIEIDAALRRLEQHDADMVRVVELRWFAGLSVEETAAATGHSPRSVNRLWTGARAWLLRELEA
ncbi:MAG: ECF-type sigma factor [Chiayiivirga sp.]|jgi:RNA polymerase sigma factor (TIGR02999 family)|uniref:ECF-type sigma factor n=1 Tax=Chiayiivirga sp. TaxID=2041042 RepID=UPI0025B7E9F1|nr:ECF-type sigma factor [Chiayiivirga sp.]MCI1711940.1 ECF-type sigma factor [Chiayiivirga sp.]MCI1729466.1 ECF-type sigma factor [Chiayiivirga sp.]